MLLIRNFSRVKGCMEMAVPAVILVQENGGPL
jgi:hypothetical protein